MVRIIIQRTARPDAADPQVPPIGQPWTDADAQRRSGQRYAEPQGYPRPLPGPYPPPPAPRPPRAPRAPGGWRPRLLPRIPWWARWGAVILIAGLIFRRAVAWAVLTALAAALHLFGVNVHLPHISFGWPWQSISAGTTTNVVVGPLVLQKIEGISSPALGTENFNFVFTHTVSKNIGPWPCWYSGTFYAVGRASATVDLNPGPSWWQPATGHYELRVLRKAVPGSPGRLAISMALPLPQLPQSVHDISVDNTLSKPISTSHSWTYPGFGCGVLIQPQFSQSVLYAQAQTVAFYQATHLATVTRPLIAAAETEATAMIRNNFIQPTVNALGYTLTEFSIRWVAT
ncbi:hypothetical protein [Trebonia sp.]|uniref:hypothetical protein n=1 Tax=Trebonia sp. TaxID=2767075 RepID=UPI00260B6531|nr:hypothetical protein [Trebonia sp.]